MPGKRKKKDKGAEAEAAAPADATEGAEASKESSGGGKGKTMLLSAGLVLLGISMQRFVLAGAPEQTVVMAAPVSVEAKKGSGSVDCVKFEAQREAEAEAGGETAEKPHAKLPAASAEPSGPVTVALDEMTINLADTDQDRYLRIGIALKLGEGVTEEAFKPEMPKASDIAVRYFSELMLEDLQGVAKMDRAKGELTCLIQAAYEDAHAAEGEEKAAEEHHEPMVTEVLFTSYLTQ